MASSSQSSAAILPFSPAPPAGKLTRLPAFLGRWAAIEFTLVAAAACATAFGYHAVILASWNLTFAYVGAAVFLSILILLISIGFRHYYTAAVQTRPRHVFLINGVATVALAFSIFLSTMFILKLTDEYSRATFMLQFVSVTVVVMCVRALSYSRLSSAIEAGALEARRVVLVGDPRYFAQFEHRLRSSGIRTVGTFTVSGGQTISPAVLTAGIIREMTDYCRGHHADDVLIMGTQQNWSLAVRLATSLADLPIGVLIIPVDTMAVFAGARIAEFGNVTAMQISRPPLSAADLFIKRAFDILAATCGLLLLSPLFLMVSLAIKLHSPGPVFFRQRRHGYNNRTIRVFKFRSMTTLEDGRDFKQVVRHDPRVTRVGRILRRTNIDELPQLLNVLSGEMSIVGPRPHATAHNRMFEEKILPFSRRHNVKPGITGWAQVNGCRGETDTLEKMQRRLEHDLYYIDNWSFLLDVKIIFMTLFSKNAYLNAY
jgi:Undecaprenyl-phosphate glucose phosphotransferase